MSTTHIARDPRLAVSDVANAGGISLHAHPAANQVQRQHETGVRSVS